jgi:hypothetical protein
LNLKNAVKTGTDAPSATQDAAKSNPQIELPDVDTLSLLAAQYRFAGTNDKAAVTAALALWREARTLLEHERSKQPPEKFPRPAKPNTPFDEALRLLIPRVEKYDERLKRFRQYLAATPVRRDGKLTGEQSGLIVASEEIARPARLAFGCSFASFPKVAHYKKVRFLANPGSYMVQ